MFYNLNKFVVQPEKASSKASNVWNITNSGGVKLATAAYVPENIFIRFLRMIGFEANYGARISILDNDGNPIMGITKPFSLGLFTARIKDTDGYMGTLKEEVQGLDGRRYVFYDNDGRVLGQLEGDWRSYSLQMKDPQTTALGKISRKSEGLNKVIFDEGADYYVVDLYIDPKDTKWRKMLLGCAAAIDLILR